MRLLALVLVATLGFSASTLAHEFKLGELHIDHPWARASIGQVKNGAAYVTLSNHSQELDSLIAAASPVAKRVELHTVLMEDGVMKMREVAGIEVTPGEPTLLKPGGLHIMLMGLTAPLVEGESFPLTLTFEKAGSVEVQVKVEGATEMQGTDEMKHDHGS